MKKILQSLLVGSTLIFISPIHAAEQLEIVTYYPAPYGVYEDLEVRDHLTVRGTRMEHSNDPDLVDNSFFWFVGLETGVNTNVFAFPATPTMTLTNTNRLGIDVQIPLTTLHANGSTLFGSAFTPDGDNDNNIVNILVGDNASGTSNGITFYESDNGYGMKLGYDGSGSGVTNALRFYDNANNSIVSIENGGDVGIGTNTPGILGGSNEPTLTLEDTGDKPSIELSYRSDSIDNNREIGIIRFFEGSTTQRQVVALQARSVGTDENAGTFAIWTRPAGEGIRRRMTIDSNGKVGINITAPDSMFDVAVTSEGERIFFDSPGTDQSRIGFREDDNEIYELLYDGTNTGVDNLIKFRYIYRAADRDVLTINGEGNVAFNNMPGIGYANYYVKDWARYTKDDSNWDDFGSSADWSNIYRIIVTIPADGYLLVQTSGDMGTYYDEAYRMAVGISETSSGAPPSGAFTTAREDNAGPNQNFPYSVARVYSVSEGDESFYIVGIMDSYDGDDPRFIVSGSVQAIYFPTQLPTTGRNY